MNFIKTKTKIKKIFFRIKFGEIKNRYFWMNEFFSIVFNEKQEVTSHQKKGLEIFLKNQKSILFSNNLSNPYSALTLILLPEKFFVFFRGNQKIYFLNSLVEENIEETRKKILQNCILQLSEKKNNIYKKKTILVILMNQTCFFQIILILFMMIKNSRKKKININTFWKEDLLFIRFGKMIKPADFKKNFSDGHEDFIQIGCTFHESKIIFEKSLQNDFLFISPLFLRLLNKMELGKIVGLSHSVYIDCFHLVLLQNWENFNFISKKIFWNHIDFKKKKKKKINNNKSYFIFSKFFPQKLSFSESFENSPNYIKNNSMKVRYKENENLILLGKSRNNVFDLKNRFKILYKNFFTNFINNKPKTMLIFCRDYFDFIFVRNRLWKKFRNKKRRLFLFHEFLKPSEIFKKKELLCLNISKVILITERFYFFYRYHFPYIETVFFFSNPLNPEFFSEISRHSKKDGKKHILSFLATNEARRC
jgi:hypothetical protein